MSALRPRRRTHRLFALHRAAAAATSSQSAAFAACPWHTLSRSTTIRVAVAAATRLLSRSHVAEPALSAQHLAVHAFAGVHTTTQARFSERKPRVHEISRFIHLCKQREQWRTPVQYLVGDWDFHAITLRVRPPVLIPRPETEELVEHLLRDMRQQSAHIVDVGCGSGAIMLAALAARPGWTATGVDISDAAVRLSKENSRLLGLQQRATIVHGRLSDACAQGGLFDALVSNPPYIPACEMSGLQREVREHEDFGALCGGEDGLEVVREVLQWAAHGVKKGGSIWLEVDTSHPPVLERKQFEHIEYVKSYIDLSGNARFCHLRRKNN
ncbi:hemk methyltransferase family member 1 [Gracilaria domingensis]|nr:hemk methyltransferase family member 1 [Gracilaria domingensis]